MSDFKYSAEKINKMIDESGCQKAIMSGVYNDLKKLKPIIEKIYDENIFYLPNEYIHSILYAVLPIH